MPTCSRQTLVKDHAFLVKPAYYLKSLYGVRGFCLCDISVVQEICTIKWILSLCKQNPTKPYRLRIWGFIKREPGRNIHRDSFQQIFICWFQSYFFAQHVAEICSCFCYIIFNIAHNTPLILRAKIMIIFWISKLSIEQIRFFKIIMGGKFTHHEQTPLVYERRILVLFSKQ